MDLVVVELTHDGRLMDSLPRSVELFKEHLFAGCRGGVVAVIGLMVLVQLLGFRRGGIARNSPGSRMMSTYGGNSSGLVSLLQSIGATFLGIIACLSTAYLLQFLPQAHPTV